MMKQLLVSILILSFLAVGVWNFLIMDHNHTSKPGLCLANVARALGCTGEIGSNAYHLNIFKAFFSATLSSILSLNLLSLLLLLLMIGLVFAIGGMFYRDQAQLAVWAQTLASHQPTYKVHLQNWLKLLGKRDNSRHF